MSDLGPCDNCRYWHGPPGGWGTCRRHAPQLAPINTQWPATHYADWCGDFKAKSLSSAIDAMRDTNNAEVMARAMCEVSKLAGNLDEMTA